MSHMRLLQDQPKRRLRTYIIVNMSVYILMTPIPLQICAISNFPFDLIDVGWSESWKNPGNIPVGWLQPNPGNRPLSHPNPGKVPAIHLWASPSSRPLSPEIDHCPTPSRKYTFGLIPAQPSKYKIVPPQSWKIHGNISLGWSHPNPGNRPLLHPNPSNISLGYYLTPTFKITH